MTCEEAGCYEAAIISIRKDLFGKSDAMRHLCSHHAPRWLAVSGQVNEKAIGGSDVCHTCAAHVKVITEDLEPRIRALEAELAVEKMAHSVTIADEHESRSEFQDRIRALEAALRTYGGHQRGCVIERAPPWCSCGWIETFPKAMGATELETKGESGG